MLKLGMEAVVGVLRHQFAVGRHRIGASLVPIIEPEIDIHSLEMAAAEGLLKTAPLGANGSRDLPEGVRAGRSPVEFHAVLDASIANIYQASMT